MVVTNSTGPASTTQIQTGAQERPGILKSAKLAASVITPSTVATAEGATHQIFSKMAKYSGTNISDSKFGTTGTRLDSTPQTAMGRLNIAESYLSEKIEGASDTTGRAQNTPTTGASSPGRNAIERLAEGQENNLNKQAKLTGYQNYHDSFGIYPVAARAIGSVQAFGELFDNPLSDIAKNNLSNVSTLVLLLASVAHTVAGSNNKANANEQLQSPTQFVKVTEQASSLTPGSMGDAFRPFMSYPFVGGAIISAVKEAAVLGLDAAPHLSDEASTVFKAAAEVASVVAPYFIGREAGRHVVRNVMAMQGEAGFSLKEPVFNEKRQQIADTVAHKEPVPHTIEGQNYLELGQIIVPAVRDNIFTTNEQTETRTVLVLTSADGTDNHMLLLRASDQENNSTRNIMPPTMRHPDVDSSSVSNNNKPKSNYIMRGLKAVDQTLVNTVGGKSSISSADLRKLAALGMYAGIGNYAVSAPIGESVKNAALENGSNEKLAAAYGNFARSVASGHEWGSQFIGSFNTFDNQPTEDINESNIAYAAFLPAVGGRYAVFKGITNIDTPRLDRGKLAQHATMKSLMMRAVENATSIKVDRGESESQNRYQSVSITTRNNNRAADGNLRNVQNGIPNLSAGFVDGLIRSTIEAIPPRQEDVPDIETGTADKTALNGEDANVSANANRAASVNNKNDEFKNEDV